MGGYARLGRRRVQDRDHRFVYGRRQPKHDEHDAHRSQSPPQRPIHTTERHSASQDHRDASVENDQQRPEEREPGHCPKLTSTLRST